MANTDGTTAQCLCRVSFARKSMNGSVSLSDSYTWLLVHATQCHVGSQEDPNTRRTSSLRPALHLTRWPDLHSRMFGSGSALWSRSSGSAFHDISSSFSLGLGKLCSGSLGVVERVFAWSHAVLGKEWLINSLTFRETRVLILRLFFVSQSYLQNDAYDSIGGRYYKDPENYIFSDKYFGDFTGDPDQEYAVTNGLFAYWPVPEWSSEKFGTKSSHTALCAREEWYRGTQAKVCDECCGRGDDCVCDPRRDTFRRFIRGDDDLMMIRKNEACMPYLRRNTWEAPAFAREYS